MRTLCLLPQAGCSSVKGKQKGKEIIFCLNITFGLHRLFQIKSFLCELAKNRQEE